MVQVNAGTELEATAIATDIDPGDILVFDFKWYDGAAVIHEDLAVPGTLRQTLPGFFAVSRLPAGTTVPGQTIRIVATASDGALCSVPMTEEVRVISNVPVMEGLSVVSL